MSWRFSACSGQPPQGAGRQNYLRRPQYTQVEISVVPDNTTPRTNPLRFFPIGCGANHNATQQPVMPDDHSESVPPLPIPNRTVKRLHADDSADCPCESR